MNEIEDPKLFDKIFEKEMVEVDLDLKAGKVLFSFFPENAIQIVRLVRSVSVSVLAYLFLSLSISFCLERLIRVHLIIVLVVSYHGVELGSSAARGRHVI